MPNKIDKRIIERAKARISQLRQDMYDYMISPKNAFRLFNVEGNNRMTFQQFQNMVNRIDTQANREQMPFHIVKDIFELINLRKDTHLDLNEFL